MDFVYIPKVVPNNNCDRSKDIAILMAETKKKILNFVRCLLGNILGRINEWPRMNYRKIPK